jgi:putative FmdB family regulatory protein
MPTYEYQCGECGHRFEVFQRIVDPPVRDCPKCGKKNCVEQLISGGSGIIFRGSGFYETDYKRTRTKNSSSGEGPGKSDSGTSAPDTSD